MDILIIAGWFGLCTGLLEAVVFTVIRLVPGWITWTMQEVNVSIDFLWIAPLVNLALFLAAGLLVVTATSLFALVPRLRALIPPDPGVFLFAWLTAYAALRVPDRLYRSAALVLSLGLAVRIWMWFRARPAVRVAWFRRSLPWLLMVVAATAVVTRGGAWVVEGARLRALAPAPDGAPNVLLIVLDTLRADHLSSYGYARPTAPNLDRIAREGVLFERAIAPSSWTLPSHASLFTGRYLHEHRADSANSFLGTEYVTLAEVLAARGLATAGFSANTNWATRNAGLARGFIHFEDYFQSTSDSLFRTVLGREIAARGISFLGERHPLGRPRAGDITDAFTTWLDSISGAPFFAFLNYFDSHAPYSAPAPYHTRFMTERQRSVERGFAFRPPLVAGNTTPGEESLFEAAYDGAVAYLDANIDRLFRKLDERGLLDRTLVVIVSDHGEAFADHGLYSHGHSLFIDQIHVPLIIRLRGTVPAGVRIKDPVSTADLAATILRVQGPDGPGSLPGRSLARFWERPRSGPPEESEPILSEVGPRDGVPATWPISAGWVRSLIAGDWHFIERQRGQVELYRLSDDPRELRNLAGTREAQALVPMLRLKLARLVVESRSVPHVRQPQQ